MHVTLSRKASRPPIDPSNVDYGPIINTDNFRVRDIQSTLSSVCHLTTVAFMPQCCVLSVTLCIVAKRCASCRTV